MPDYHELLVQIERLPYEEQWRLFEALIISVHRRSKEKHLHNMMEFKGFAKDFWKDVDIDKYIDDERNSWEK